jgi:hypothetical protein
MKRADAVISEKTAESGRKDNERRKNHTCAHHADVIRVDQQAHQRRKRRVEQRFGERGAPLHHGSQHVERRSNKAHHLVPARDGERVRV